MNYIMAAVFIIKFLQFGNEKHHGDSNIFVHVDQFPIYGALFYIFLFSFKQLVIIGLDPVAFY